MNRRDPRWYQIASLSLLLVYGTLALRFDVTIFRVALILGTALAVQLAGTRLSGLAAIDPKSALISGLSLCLLLRTNSPALAVAGAGAAIGGKFLLRARGKHFFNPTNFALVLLLICAPAQAWVSPAQWGSVAFFGFLMLCLGGLVVHRAARADVALAFLGCYLGLLFATFVRLGEPVAIPLHRLQSGSLLLFAFFMISDPKTTPDSRAGRVLFGDARGLRGVVGAIPAFPHQRAALEPRRLLAAGAPARFAVARQTIRLARSPLAGPRVPPLPDEQPTHPNPAPLCNHRLLNPSCP